MFEITLTESGFKARSENGDLACVFWEEVREIVAFKRDLLTVDLICLGFRISDSDDYFEIDEEDAGYQTLVSELERRFDIDEGWWSKVAFPPFGTNAMTLWRGPLLSKSPEDDSGYH